jgi:outer membrane biosynthesis protein TonB
MIFRTSSPSFYSYGETPNRQKYALLAAVLFHGLVLFLLLQPKYYVLKKPAGSAGEKMVWAEPLSITPPKLVSKPITKPQLAAKTPPPPKLASKAKPSPPVKQVAQKNPLPPTPLPTPAPVLPTITTPVPTPPPAEDMMAQVEANRQRRAQARIAQGESPAQEESEAQRGLRQAQANLANLQAKAQGSGRDEHGGVFKLGSINYHKAEFTFNGWNKNFRRQWPRLVEVQLGNEPDIETAIIKSMIALIRKEREAEFTWDSHRLGRIVELNAKPEFGNELQAFLMREFFPAYRTVARQ